MAWDVLSAILVTCSHEAQISKLILRSPQGGDLPGSSSWVFGDLSDTLWLPGLHFDNISYGVSYVNHSRL